MTTTTVRDQIRSNPDLIPSLPDVVARAMQLVDDPEVTPGHFEELLSRDPPLVASLLRLANSPIYGFAHKRETVRDAIIGMGLKGLRGMLLGTTLKRFLGSKFVSYGEDPKALWHHAMAVGAGAKAMTKKLPNSPDDAEEMFVAGLLHDLGKLLLAPFLSRLGKDMTKFKEPAHVVEERLLGLDHQEAGGIVAEKWNLKPMAQAVITHHHFKACPKNHRHAVAVVRLADLCATELGHGAGALESERTFLGEDLEVVGLQPQEWDELRPAIAEAMTAALSGS